MPCTFKIWIEFYQPFQIQSKSTPVEGLGEGGSGVVQTAWALLGLLAGQCRDQGALERGVRFLMARQRPNGACALAACV